MTRASTILAAALCLSVLLPRAVYASDPDRELESYRKNREDIEASVSRTMEELDRLARPVPGWNAGGADPHSDLKAMGADRYYFANRGSFGVSVTILTDRPIEDFAPKSWRLLDSYGTRAAGEGEPWVNFIHWFDGRYVMASTGRTVRNGGAFCGSDGGEYRLFERPDVKRARGEPGTGLAREIFASTIRTMAREPTSCSRYYGDRVRGYTRRDFTLDGREQDSSLPAAEPPANSTHRIIVPACPIERVLKRPFKITRKMLRTPGFRMPRWNKAPRPRSC